MHKKRVVNERCALDDLGVVSCNLIAEALTDGPQPADSGVMSISFGALRRSVPLTNLVELNELEPTTS